MSVFIDPSPGLYPYCRCDKDCEFPCWQRDGLDSSFDANDPRACCCGSLYGEHLAEAREVEDHQERKHDADQPQDR